MNALKKLIALSVLFSPALASAGAGSCTTSDATNPIYTICVDYTGSVWTSSIVSQGCTSAATSIAATYSTGNCPTAGAIGKCSNNIYPPASNETYYYGLYATAVDTLSSSCTSTGQTWTSLSGSATIPPFTAVTTGVTAAGLITDPIATVTTRITVNTADVGKTGSVFVTAMVPSGSLGTTLAMRGENMPSTMALAAPATNSPILANLTSTGWKQVVNGQMIPYSTGVLSGQLAAINILNNADTTSLTGSQFCVGYGTSVTEMNSTGRMQLIATVPNPNAAGAAASCILISNDRVFAYAEANYPTLFTGTATAGQYQQYDYQYYQASQNYLAVDTSGMIFLLGSYTNGAITPVGQVESFRSYITDWEAAP